MKVEMKKKIEFIIRNNQNCNSKKEKEKNKQLKPLNLFSLQLICVSTVRSLLYLPFFTSYASQVVRGTSCVRPPNK